MAASRKRIPFNAAGPFLARKNFSVFGTAIVANEAYEADVFSALHERRIEQLFDSNHIDMAPAGAKPVTALEAHAADPLDRDGDGERGGSLSDAEIEALAADGLTLDQWLQLPEPERVTALADAMASAPASELPGDDTGAGGEGSDTGPETAPQGDAGASGGEGATEGAEAPEIASGEPVAMKSFGIGQWWRVDAAGNKVGKRIMGQGNARAAAAADRLPILGQNGQPLDG